MDKMLLADFLRKHVKELTGDMTTEAFRSAVKTLAVADGVELTDADGSTVNVEELEITTIQPAAKDATADNDKLASAIEKAVEKAFKAYAPASKRITQSEPESRIIIPATAKRWHAKHLRPHLGEKADETAYKFGVWFCAAYGAPWAVKRAHALGIPIIKTASEGVNTAGGFLVPEEFDGAMIDLREQYGVFRQHARPVPMASDTKSIRRRTGGLTAYFVGESTAGTESTKAWDRVNLTARKMMALTVTSNELNEDAVINIGDDVANEIGYAFAYKEDLCGFIGDGSSTYGGILGITDKLQSVFTVTTATVGGIACAAGNLITEATLANFREVVGLLPQYADNDRTAWYCHRQTWNQMQALEQAAGGATATELVNGQRVLRFLGYPVVITQAMETGTLTSLIMAVLGDLSLAASFGDRRGTTIAFSDSALNAFEQDEIAIRGTARFDIVVHDVGSGTTAGPIVALQGLNA